MDKLIYRVTTLFIHQLYKRTVLVLSLMFCIGIIVSLSNTYHLSSKLIKSQAIQHVTDYAETIKEARTLYSSEVVAHAMTIEGLSITHDYKTKEEAIPLPATFLIELGERIQLKNPGMSVRLYSNYPFPWRQAEGGPRDDFELKAIRHLEKNPDLPFYKFVEFQGRPSFRYTQADIMKPSCVSCHNNHPDSPKKDWKVGDVRGVLEITQPLDSTIKMTNAGLRDTFFTLAGLSVLGVAGLTLVISKLRRTSTELERRVVERTAELAEEKEKSESLLLNILPEQIAERLKQGHQQIADGFAEVTILFADIVGFTLLSEKIPPEELVILLNKIFSEFDRLSDRHGLEKIKTIGDAYMVASGLPIPRTDHVEAVAEMALDMQQAIAEFNLEHNCQLSIRIGINSGPVIAGVIGTKKFIYDLWGDAVNTASRMESHGIPGAIQVTTSTYHLLQNKYIFQERGVISVKGKGEMKTYLLVRRKISTTQEISKRIDRKIDISESKINPRDIKGLGE
ncbi:adenylate/guanylate cyclase domain-containing protein [Dapis sp. BLCC M172]|uniref:adenylate/guanylate cyclase domain-containing protein n=1 Tax=Dapis sp. BLCC M172 TaxID=2975281 RepID=UPI003CF7DB13